MTGQPYPKMYLYRRLVQAKLFIDAHFAESRRIEKARELLYDGILLPSPS